MRSGEGKPHKLTAEGNLHPLVQSERYHSHLQDKIKLLMKGLLGQLK